MRSSPSSPSSLVLVALAARVSDALVPLIRAVHGPAPLAPADSVPPATSATESVVSAEAIRIRCHVRQPRRDPAGRWTA